MDELPVEILHLVFSHLLRNDLFQCQTTCKSWYRPAQRYAYKNVLLQYQAQAEKYLDTVAAVQELGLLAESIDLNQVFLPQFYAASSDRFKILSRLAELCPNVRCLNTSDTNNGFFKSLLPVYRQGHFQYLENIPIPKGWAVFRDYMQCVMAMRGKLTRLTIGDSTNRQCYFDDIFQDDFMDEMTSKLNEFTHLKSLSFIKHTDKHIFEFDDILQRCPQLESFSFTAYSLKRIESIGMFNYLSDDIYMPVDLEQIQPRPRISSFIGNFLLMSDESLKYIMFKLPKLLHLDINTNHQDHQLVADLKNRGFGFSSKTMLQFLLYVFQMKSARFHNVRMPNAVDFLSYLLNSVNYSGAMDIRYKRENQSFISADNPMLQFDVNSSHSSAWVANKITAIFEVAQQYGKTLLREQKANTLPHQAILETSGKYLQFLTLANISQPVMQDYDADAACLLDYTFQSCPSLKALAMVDCSLISNNSTSALEVTNKSIEKLSFEHCQLDEQDLTNISLHIPLLKHLNVTSCAFTHSTSGTVEINMSATLFDTLFYTDSFISKAFIQLTTASAGSTYVVAQNGTCCLSTIEDYQSSLNIQSKHTFRLNICCKSIRTLSISMKNNHISHCHVDTLLCS
ncbi:hypothetical protein MAM1_0013c01343 [Mucor ambiguus]|uniref:F-box domain-containing protein n=1 Tax=Mucor ambiguus TaxID=91626 RepID=A0A0C9MFM5_9FUNG|nr:hypothetical protein MAM1_0013c01343 [Mucor ambiguus]